MKLFRLFILTALVLFSCKSEPKIDGYLVEGKAPGVYNGIRAYLKSSASNKRQVPIDTAIVMNETFTFQGKTKTPGLHFLTVDNVRGSLKLILDNEVFSVSINKDNINNSTIEGSEATNLFNSYNDEVNQKFKAMQSLMTERRTAGYNKDTLKINELDETLKMKRDSIEAFGFDFVKQHPKSIVSLVLLENMSKNKKLDEDKFIETFGALDENLKTSSKGKTLEFFIKKIMIKREKDAALKIGNSAPTFSAPDVNGNSLALNDVLGKVTIIDFWASWCGPCRKENPNVVKLYEKYHDKGLEILGVSLDRRGQKEQWLKAIETDKLAWQQVSNLNYFNGPVAKLYSVSAIPATFLLDEKGKIIAKNLRGIALERKLETLLGS